MVISKAPFQVGRFGWGTFTVRIIVHFSKYFKSIRKEFDHNLVFEIGGRVRRYVVDCS